MFYQPSCVLISARNSFSAVTLLVLLSAAFLLAASPAQATTVAGRTAGSFAVSPTGAATYTIPIWAPPGPNGLQPQIALVYNSQGGGGSSALGPTTNKTCITTSNPLQPAPPCASTPQRSGSSSIGIGWSLQGLSAIYRCNLTLAQDAAPAPVALATSDGYCMDGQRLRLTAGTYGTNGSTYQTEVANFINVTAHGSAGNGPAYWTAQDRNGRTYTYGNGGNSQVLANGSSTAVSWQLNEVSDPPGNTMTISYTTATGAADPATISWTPSSYGSSTYNYTMTFSYGSSVSPPKGYVAGTLFTDPNLLNSIKVNYSGNLVKDYILNYQSSPTTGREELITVTECSDAGVTCLLPTQVQYQSGSAGVSSAGTTTPGVLPVLLYDFNGDGLPDVAYFSNGVLYVALNTGSGFGTPINTGITDASAMYGDVLGTGSDGIFANNGGTFYYYTYNASSNSFSGVSTGIAVQASYKYVLTDITGDGLPDLVGLFGLTDMMVTVQNTSSGGVVRFGTPYNFNSTFTTGNKKQFLSALSGHPKPNRYLDFNGDGRNDVFVETVTWTQIGPGEYDYRSNYYQLISQGANAPFQVVQVSFDNTNGQHVVFGNFNNDNCTDVAVGNQAFYSACNGTIGQVITLPGSDAVITAIDWDGDGLTDLLAGAPGGVLNWYHATGGGFASEASTGYTLASSCPANPTVVDMNGDGLEDLDCYNIYYVHNGAGTPPDLVSSITDGYGNYFDPTYKSATGPCYYRDGTPPSGDTAARDPIYLVCSYTASDGVGGSYSVSFDYYDSDTQLGRGWQGFERTYSVDSRNNIVHMTSYSTAFPNTGVVTYVLDRQSDWTTYIRLFNPTLASLSQETLSSTPYQQRYFPWFTQSQVQTYELGGTKNGQLITTSTTTYGTPDAYGNFPTITVATQDNDSTSPYYGTTWTTATTNTLDVDTTHWCLNLYTQVQVAYSDGTPADAVTRTKTLTPDTTNCRYTAIVTEPNSSQFKVTESRGYDSFGNVNSDTVTGTNMTARQTTASWGTTGQFPMSITDPTGAQTQYNYNFSYGLKSSVTDPNNLTTAWQYADGFGRRTQETRPDGTYTHYNYQNCSGTSGCLVGSNGLVVNYAVYNTNGSVQSPGGAIYFDSVDRQLVSNQVMLSGSYSRNEVRYDSLGRVSQKAFPCTWTSLTTTCSYWTTNTFDILDRLTQSQRPVSSTNSNLQTTTYAYAGRTTTVTDPQSNARITVTDVNGWLRQTKDPMGYNVTLAYDSAGSKTKVTDSLGNTLWSGTYNYGLAAFPATSNDMDMGNWSYTFNALGEQTAWTDAKTQSFSATYDALSRPLTRTEPDLFTQWVWGSSATNHNIGKLQSACTGTGSSCASSGYAESETYDGLGRRSQRSITISGYSAFTYTWGYDSNTGLLSTLTYPTSTSGYALQLQYAYANGVLQSVKDISDTPNVTVWTANTMDPAGHVTQETLGNNIVTNRTYDPVTQWLGTAQSGVGGGAGVKNLAFLYDEMGNVTQRQDNNLGLTENIYYDNDYRFSYSKLNGTQNLAVWIDVSGNITARSDIAGGASWTYDPNRKHEVTQAGSSVECPQIS